MNDIIIWPVFLETAKPLAVFDSDDTMLRHTITGPHIFLGRLSPLSYYIVLYREKRILLLIFYPI